MIKRLWITEKPSAARDLAAGICSALNTSIQNQSTISKDGYIKLENGEIVSFLMGHLIQSVFLSPQHKTARLDQYFDFLPIVVKDFKYEPSYEFRNNVMQCKDGKPIPKRQYVIVKDLIQHAVEIVNAGDTDREGQLIVDEMLMHCGVNPERIDRPIYRLPLISDQESVIRKQVLNLSEKNSDKKWVLRRNAALARLYCDAAVGFNSSMAYQAASGYRRVSLGRVQTPVLCIIIDRDDQINNFVPKKYYIPIVTMSDGTEMKFYRRENAKNQDGFDEEGRIIDENVAKQICSIIGSGMNGQILTSQKIKGIEPPPLPFSSTVLASTVSKRTGMTPGQAEKAAQSVYSKHGAITYVGTDCQFLPDSLLADTKKIMIALAKLYPRQVGMAQLDLKSNAWNDSKLDEHHAIIPTGLGLDSSATPEEKSVYDAVCTRLIAQFYPAHEYVTNQISALFGKDEFRVTSRETIKMGWKEIEGNLEQGGPDCQVEEEFQNNNEIHDQSKRTQELNR